MTTSPHVRPGSAPGAAIPALVDLYGPRIHALALRLLRHRADADDLVQETFLRAFRAWPQFRGDSDPGTWLYTIAVRLAKPRLRRRGGVDRRTPAVSQLMPWNETTVLEVAAAPSDAQDPLERAEAIARVQTAIAALPEHLRVPLVLKEVLGLSVEDAGAALRLAPNTVKTRLHRARLALRKSMTKRGQRVTAPAPIYEKQVCLDLLKAKLAGMDRASAGKPFVVPQAEVCARCRAVFRELDMVQEACAALGSGALPPRVRSAILAEIARRDADEARAAALNPRRGRRPLKPRAKPPARR